MKIKYWLFFLLVGTNAFAGASRDALTAAEVADWLAPKVRHRASRERNCTTNTRMALSLLRQTDSPFQAFTPILDANWPGKPALPGMVNIQKITFILPELIEDAVSAGGYDRVHLSSLVHSFLLLQDNGSEFICDSFQYIHRFSCRPIQNAQVFVSILDEAISHYLVDPSRATHNAIMSMFLTTPQLADHQFLQLQTPVPKERFGELAIATNPIISKHRFTLTQLPTCRFCVR